ncbi:MAG: NUDIX hydrolase [Candidatus Syntropharchaeia archaeon]
MKENQITVAVGAIVENDKGEILLVRHVPERGGFWQGKFIFPGGKLEVGERIKEGIKREVKEETHLEIELISPIEPFERIVRSQNGVKLHVIYIDYIAKVVGGELKPDSDIGEAIWVNKKEILKIKDLHEDTRKLLEMSGIA